MRIMPGGSPTFRTRPCTSTGASATVTVAATAAFGRGAFYRVDYVLPSVGLPVQASGVFWPVPGEAGADWVGASDHHMVWVDLGADG